MSLESLRLKRGLTLEQLAEKTGLKCTTVRKLEDGFNNIAFARAETVWRLAKALGVTMEDLLQQSQEEQNTSPDKRKD